MLWRYLSLTAVLVAAACAPLPEFSRGQAIPPGSRYVSLGSSFAAGAGIGPTQPGTPERCGRTVNNYASLLADALDLALVDVSCGGATTAHALGPWDELPAQLEAVTPDTRLVTVTIGGNDLGYVGDLFAASCTADGRSRVRPDSSCSQPEYPSEAEYRATRRSLRAIAREVRRRAPGATLVFIQYVTLVPEDLCPATPLPARSAEAARETAARLAELTAQVAAEADALLVPAAALSDEHTPCDAEPWANGFPLDHDREAGAPWHPNAVGHAAIARRLAEMLAG